MLKNTVDQAEVDKFGKLSQEWWTSRGLKGLRSLNMIRVPYIQSTIDRSSPGRKRILDIGCGGGFLSEGLAHAFHSSGWNDDEIEIIAMDPAPESITVAQTHLPSHLKGKVTYICDTIENYVTLNPSSKFDTVVMSEVIEHVENPADFLKYGISVVKPQGSIILTTPAKTLLSWMGVILFAEHIMHIVPVGTHEYKKFVALSAAQEMLKENGCEIKDVRGGMYNPITDTWKWNNLCKLIWYAIHAVKAKE